jgi:hypothetical protein
VLEKYRERMRFLGTADIFLNTENWHSKISEFKSFIRKNTNYQLIDNRVYWQCNPDLSECIPLLGVIGTPMVLDRPVVLVDTESGRYWVREIDFFSIYNATFDSIRPQIISILETIPPQMGKIFHLVMDEEKIELHFFLEKDYIG